MLLSKDDFKVSTMTMSCRFPDCRLNLLTIGKYLDIDEDIIGLKYNNAFKGEYSTTIYKKSKQKNIEKINKDLFYNQISMIVRLDDRDINVKLFANGSLHLTGCKKEEDATNVALLIYRKLQEIRQKQHLVFLVKDNNGVYLDKDDVIYSINTTNLIGFKKDGRYIIDKKEYSVENIDGRSCFIVVKEETRRMRSIYSMDGEHVGYLQVELLKDNKKLYTKNGEIFYDKVNKLLFYNNTHIIGKLNYVFFKNEEHDYVGTNNDCVELVYNVNPFIQMPETMPCDKDLILANNIFDASIHCINICFSLKYKINRQKLYERLMRDTYICKYRPESYSGIKLIFKIRDFKNAVNELDGRCTCSYKCICTNVTFLIFQSGNVIASGFKSFDNISNILESFIAICYAHCPDICVEDTGKATVEDTGKATVEITGKADQRKAALNL